MGSISCSRRGFVRSSPRTSILFPTRMTGICMGGHVVRRAQRNPKSVMRCLWCVAFLACAPYVTQPVRDALHHVLRIDGIAQAHDVRRAELLVHLVWELSCKRDIDETDMQVSNYGPATGVKSTASAQEVSTMWVATRSFVTDGGMVSSGTTSSTCSYVHVHHHRTHVSN